MNPDFVTWWFDVHYIWSTLITPFFSIMWVLYTDGNVGRLIVGVVLSLLYLFLSLRSSSDSI